MTRAIGRLLPFVPMAAVAAVVLGRLPWRTPGVLLAFLFVSIATVAGVVQRLGEGVYYNAHFETMIAVCLAFGLALSSASGTTLRLRGHALGPAPLAIVAALPLLVMSPWHLARAWGDIHDASAREAAWRPVIATGRASLTPSTCSTSPRACWWAVRSTASAPWSIGEGSGSSSKPALVHSRGRRPAVRPRPNHGYLLGRLCPGCRRAAGQRAAGAARCRDIAVPGIALSHQNIETPPVTGISAPLM